MKAIQVKQVGGPEAMELVELPVPESKANEAVVKIAASGVNFIDVYFREGRYPAPLPFINGQEGARLVVAVGPDVTALRLGDRVAYTGSLGSYAEYAAVPAERLIKIPDELDFTQAAAAMLRSSGAAAAPLSTAFLAVQRCGLLLSPDHHLRHHRDHRDSDWDHRLADDAGACPAHRDCRPERNADSERVRTLPRIL